MSMNNKQRWMGGVVLLGGGVLLAALLFKGSQELGHKDAVPAVPAKEAVKPAAKAGEMQALQPLTVDVETEKRLLEEQRRARERAVAEQEARTQQYLAQQQQVEADAARKAAEEYAEINKRRMKQDNSDNIPPDLGGDKSKLKPETPAKDTKKPTDVTAQKQADDEAKHKADVAAKKKAEAEAQHKADLAAKKKADEEAQRKADLAAKKKAENDAQHKADLEAKKRAEAKHQAEEDKQAELAAKKAADKKKADAEKARKMLDDDDRKKWMVQVALAGNQANADSIVAKLRAKGYKVTTSPTSKGIRIMVGPAKDRDTADVARKKIQADESLGMKSAWVIDWVPLDQR
ncbi:SPOR domain-containing protein [Acinetobacter sp. MD2(2019)]|uniref:SPOR domain-containing protein n=1 Tax=Acinetobacter sp. MD2(2019) TaxID=2605273 RepID=UPI002D1EBDC9|nr:SPOR domain-containing protein [Acinetobacter sp. MD2(2019)]MEB3754696.1 SPOR domain-containing protein [Acinetobacter sp. MD2(2019)]